MSDRLATQCADIGNDIETAHENAETEKQRSALRKAAGLLKAVEEEDRERNGATPEDQLAAHIENTDQCPNCGEELEEGGWCSLSCMREDLADKEEAEP